MTIPGNIPPTRARLRPRGGTAAEWTTANPILGLRELAVETDTRKLKVGDGASAWSDLGYVTATGGGGGAVDWGDIGGTLADQTDLQAALDTKAADAAKPDTGDVLLLDGTQAMTGDLDMGSQAIVSVGNVDGRDLSADGSKLDGIETGATADQTGAEIKSAYEGEADTNAFTDAEQTKLSGIETAATADQAWGDIGGTLSDQTDLQSELDAKADLAGAAFTGAITTTSTVDGRDVASDGTKLDGIESAATADQTDAEIATAYGNEVDQVSSGEKTAGTETAIRRFSPKDVADMAGTHGGGGGGTDDQNASEVPFTPAGDLAATDVQAALEELDTEKAASSHTHTLSDVTDSGDLAALDTVGSAEIDAGAVTSTELDSAANIRTYLNVEDGATADQSAADIRGLGFFDTSNDGTGSGLDADLLDGNEASAFATASHTHTLADVTDSGDLAALDTVGSSEIDAGAVTSTELDSAANIRTYLNVEDGATNTGDPLADADQTLAADRTIDGSQQLTVSLDDGSDVTLTVDVDPATGRISLSSVDAGAAATSLQINPGGFNFVFPLASGAAIDSDFGDEGDVFSSNGSGSAPEWRPGIVSGTSAPSNTDAIWFHTTDQVFYTYDTSRSEWLGPEQQFTAAVVAVNSTGNVFLEFGGRVPMAPNTRGGFCFAHHAKVTGWIWRCRGGQTVSGGGRTLRMGKFDESAGTYSGTFRSVTPPAAWSVYQETDLDLDFDVEDALGLFTVPGTGTTAISDPACTVTFRRRPS